jgi:hypothetical protein
MKLKKVVQLSLIFCLSVVSAAAAMPPPAAPVAERASPLTPQKKKEIRTRLRGMTVPFIANKGQVDKQVAFQANTFGGTIFVTHTGEIVYSLPTDAAKGTHGKASGLVVRERLKGAKPAQVKGFGKPDGTANYFIGKDKADWKRNIPAFATISLGEMYQGIELRLRAYGENVEKLFHVRPGGDYKKIQVNMEGADSLRVLDSGELEVQSPIGSVRFTSPVAYQETESGRKLIDVAYLVSGTSYSFALGEYDKNREVIIDPLLASTFFGSNGIGGGTGTHGGDGDNVAGIAVDKNGKIFLVGTTSLFSFPTTSGAYDNTNKNFSASFSRNIFISRLNPDLTSLEASTFLGGSTSEEDSPNIALDSLNRVFVAGTTSSSDFPTTSGAYCRTQSISGDIFISRLNADLTTLEASTLLGGSSYDNPYSLVVDNANRVFVTGLTQSGDFPTTSGAYNETRSCQCSGYGSTTDVFISRLDADLTTLQASTFLGGTEDEDYPLLALDSSGNLVIAGQTASTDFPVTEGAYDTEHTGSWSDIFISRLDADLTTLTASTLLGGTSGAWRPALAVSSSDKIYVAGTTGEGFPVTMSAYDTTHNGADGVSDAFVARFSHDLQTLERATYLGGSTYEYPASLALSASNKVYVSGQTSSTDFPVTSSGYDRTNSAEDNVSMADIFVSRLNEDLTILEASTFLGGQDSEFSPILAVDSANRVFVTGTTRSHDFPVTGGAYDTSLWGYTDIFVARLDSELQTLGASTFLGGCPGDDAVTVARDSSGNLFVAGVTYSQDYPTTSGVYDETHNNGERDIFISRLNAEMTDMTASTFLGGANLEGQPDIAVTASNNVVLAGVTLSEDFPTTEGSYNSDPVTDIFVSRLSNDLSTLQRSVRLGVGSAPDIEVLGDTIFVAGETHSSYFPVTSGGPYNNGKPYNGTDIFIARLNDPLLTDDPENTPTFSAMFLGGSSYESAPALVVTPGISPSSSGEIYITGTTESEDFPIKSDPFHSSYDTTYNSPYKDIFVAHFTIPVLTTEENPDDFLLVASTFLGGSSGEYSPDIAVSSDNKVFITGKTGSSDFPVTSGTYDESRNNNGLFISRLDANLSELEASTYFGAGYAENPAIAVTPANKVIITGTTDSSDFPVTSNAYDKTYNGGDDIFISSLNPDLTTLDYSSYFGGKADDDLLDILLTPDNEIILGGRTRSADFPVTAGAYDVDNSEGDSLFLTKLSLDSGSGAGSGKFSWNMFLPAIISGSKSP